MRNRKFLIEQVENLVFYLMLTRRRKLLRGIDSIQCLKVVLTNPPQKNGKTIILYKSISYIFALFLEIIKIFSFKGKVQLMRYQPDFLR